MQVAGSIWSRSWGSSSIWILTEVGSEASAGRKDGGGLEVWRGKKVGCSRRGARQHLPEVGGMGSSAGHSVSSVLLLPRL